MTESKPKEASKDTYTGALREQAAKERAREQWTRTPPTEPGLYLKWSQGAVKAEVVVVGQAPGAALAGSTVQWLKLTWPLPEGA